MQACIINLTYPNQPYGISRCNAATEIMRKFQRTNDLQIVLFDAQVWHDGDPSWHGIRGGLAQRHLQMHCLAAFPLHSDHHIMQLEKATQRCSTLDHPVTQQDSSCLWDIPASGLVD